MKDYTVMLDRPVLYDLLRKSPLMGPVLTREEVRGVDALLDAIDCCPDIGAARLAYMLATDYHETGGTMEAVREIGSNSYLTRRYDIQGQNPKRARRYGNVKPGDGVRYCGRGLVQLTWYINYLKAGQKLNIDLVGKPELAMELGIAAQIMVEGMREGWFTGAKLSLLPAGGRATLEQFTEARKIINGTDRADKIAKYALLFQDYLIKAGMM